MMKVGDIVKHWADDCLGVVIDINWENRRGFHNAKLFPYLIYFCDGDYDWFKPSAVTNIIDSSVVGETHE